VAKRQRGHARRSTRRTGTKFFAIGAFFSKASIAAPLVTWAPSSITDTVSPGATQTIPLSFAASANLANVVINFQPNRVGSSQMRTQSGSIPYE
jgi:hypothetical protein